MRTTIAGERLNPPYPPFFKVGYFFRENSVQAPIRCFFRKARVMAQAGAAEAGW